MAPAHGTETDRAAERRAGRLAAANLQLRRDLAAAKQKLDEALSGVQQELADARTERDEALATTASKAQLLAHMSHELRTPMNGILGMTELALQTPLDPQQREYMEVVKSSADALLTLINDILDLSKLDAGRLQLEAISFNFVDTLSSCVKSLAFLAEEKGITLHFEVDENVPAVLIGDPGRLRQILINLIGNAIKFTDEGSVQVAVSAEASRDEITLHCRVIDTGIGIPPERQSQIFQPFLQAEESTARRHGGTGLGLSICVELVGLMGGDIWLESEPGRGSTFQFTASLGRQTQEEAAELVDLDRLESLRLLVLAGELSGSAIASQLEAANMRPRPFTDDVEAAAAVLAGDADVLLVDLDEFGLNAVSELLDTTGPNHPPVLVMTSSGQRGDAARCRELGVSAYLTRPIGPHDLRDAIRGILAGPSEVLITRHWLRERRPRLEVLLADDSSSNRLVVGQMLKLQDHEVTMAESGVQAVESFKAGSFDLVLMDVEMPGMSGHDATRAIRRFEEGNGDGRVPILALTGHSSAEQIEQCLRAGMDAHLLKPFEFGQLVGAIEALVPHLRLTGEQAGSGGAD